MHKNNSRTQSMQTIVDNMGQFKRLLRSHYHPLFESLKLSQTQLELLMTIHGLEPVSHKALAAKLQLTPGAVSQLLDGLDKQECIVRSPSPTDRRISYVSLSRHGKQKLENFHSLRKKLFTQAFDALNEQELETFSQTQQKLITWLENNQPSNK